ncbi:c-Myc-binding protein-like isoform X1 [Cricetulus griseus]|uniref:c-Myc-binding protein-like isoform X1 n=1 Tax=Cricetulus griseus TaxID=10029 RepID=UPI00022F3B2C|nr:c-Myc-binding protein-like isoform X1 [Cricetulus griseus]
MAHYKAADSKREQFRRYLEKSGVLDTLTKVLVALYEEPEKPTSALDFLKHHLGAATQENPEIELLRLELAEMKEKYEAFISKSDLLTNSILEKHSPALLFKCLPCLEKTKGGHRIYTNYSSNR